jgi:hypothetical protein
VKSMERYTLRGLAGHVFACICLSPFFTIYYFGQGVNYVDFLLFKRCWIRCTNMLSFFIVVAKDGRMGHLDNQGVNGG